MVNKETLVAWAGAAGTVVSAIIYLSDFVTNVITLRTYYLYEYECSNAALASALLHDPICHAIRSGFNLRGIFWTDLVVLMVAHFTNSIVFSLSLDRSQHPLRLAYFLPLIHLHRLLKVLRHSFSSNRLKELQKSQMEFGSLYGALGSLETVPQFVIQFNTTVNLGQYIKGSTDPSKQAQKIPIALLISLVACIISNTYGTTMAVFFLTKNRMPFLKRVFISILMGIQAFVTMLAKGVSVASLIQVTGPGPSRLLALIVAIEFIIAWLFSCLLVYVHYWDRQGKWTWWVRIAHSLGLALMNRIAGPMYVLIKLRTSSCFLLWGTLLHILGELLYPVFVMFWPHEVQSPCRTSHKVDIEDQENKYLTCKMFLGITCASYTVFILATLLIICVYKKDDGSGNLIPKTFRELSREKHSMSAFKSIISTLGSAKSTKDLHRGSILCVFDYFVFLLTIICIQILQKNHLRPPRITFGFI